MIKNFLYILFFSLFLMSCSKNKQDAALENCANSNFISDYDNQIFIIKFSGGMFEKLEKEYQTIEKNHSILWNDMQSYEEKMGYSTDSNLTKLENNWHENKSDKNWKLLNDYRDQIGYSNDTELNRLRKLWSESYDLKKNKLNQLINYRKTASKEFFDQIDFKKKIEFKNYYLEYQKCELQFENTPNSFLKRWIN